MNRLLAVPLLLALSGCVPPPARVAAPQTVPMDNSYTVDLPLGWIRQFTQTGELLASRDGFPLQTIAVQRVPLKSAFPKTKKVAAESMLPSELAELAIAELKTSNEQLAALTVLENEPALVSGREGFRLRVAYKTQQGVEMLREVVGATDKTHYCALTFLAPKLYYFEKYWPDFERTVASFKLAAKWPRSPRSIHIRSGRKWQPLAAPTVQPKGRQGRAYAHDLQLAMSAPATEILVLADALAAMPNVRAHTVYKSVTPDGASCTAGRPAWRAQGKELDARRRRHRRHPVSRQAADRGASARGRARWTWH